MNTEMIEYTDMDQFEKDLEESDTFSADLHLKVAKGKVSDLIEAVRQWDEAGVVCRKGQLHPAGAYFRASTLSDLTSLMQTFGSDAIVDRAVEADDDGTALIEYHFD